MDKAGRVAQASAAGLEGGSFVSAAAIRMIWKEAYPMGLELDHVFIFVSEGAPEADLLVQCGFTEGEPNVHPGQGTSNRRFFFGNMMLELLWVSNPCEAQREKTRPTMFFERWAERKRKASPFGIVLRSPDGRIPFETWEYRPDYLPGGLFFSVGGNAALLNEPMVFVMPAGAGNLLQKTGRPPQHMPFFRTVSSVCVRMPGVPEKSSVLKTMEEHTERLTMAESERHVMEIVFNAGARCRSEDFRPGLPLIVKW